MLPHERKKSRSPLLPPRATRCPDTSIHSLKLFLPATHSPIGINASRGRGRVRARHPSFVFGQSLRALLRTALPHFCWSERARRTTQLSEPNKLPPFSLDGGRDKMQTKDQRAIEANFFSEQRERRSERVKYTSVLPFFWVRRRLGARVES